MPWKVKRTAKSGPRYDIMSAVIGVKDIIYSTISRVPTCTPLMPSNLFISRVGGDTRVTMAPLIIDVG